MPWYSRSILKKEVAVDRVVDFTPTRFDLGTPLQALEYIESKKSGSDFIMNPVIREQTGVDQIEKEDLGTQAEELAVQRLGEIQEAAYKEGYQLGLDEGTKKAYLEKKSEIHKNLESLDQLITNIMRLKSELEGQTESHLIQLLFHMASRISMRQIEYDNSILVDVLRQAISLAQDEENIRVQISEKQFEFIEELKKNGHGREFEFIKKIKFEGNSEIKPGGCVVETNYGEVDSRVEQRVEKLWDHLKEAIPKVKPIIKIGAE